MRASRMKLYLSFDRVVDGSTENEYRALIQRRGRREPLQHIVGTVSFCGLELVVNGHVLVPRPETELLVEDILMEVRDDSGKLISRQSVGVGAIRRAEKRIFSLRVELTPVNRSG